MSEYAQIGASGRIRAMLIGSLIRQISTLVNFGQQIGPKLRFNRAAVYGPAKKLNEHRKMVLCIVTEDPGGGEVRIFG